MKLQNLFIIAIFISLAACKSQPEKVDYKITGVPFNEVKINDNFWLPKIETNRTVTIPASFAKCEETGRVENFIKAAKKEGAFGTTFPFDDTDIYKIIEGASYSMSVHPDPKLDHYVDSLITIVAAAQEPDGYLYTARTIDPQHPHKWSGSERWVQESVLSHELYNSGHLFEAASAHFQATGKRNFLNIALKNADLLDQVFGPGKRNDAPGHEIVEMGLVKLYRITGEKKYLNLAKFFIDSRGKENDPKKAYSQDHKPLIQQDEAVGHAVRAGYLYSGVADVAALTGDSAYLAAIDKIWDNTVSKKLYITGGIGARHEGEAFGNNYELPNLTAYNETCAAIANVYWNYRMFLLHGDAKYIDVLERSLYNGVISGVGLDGKTFFYPNPLECDMHYHFNSGETLDRQPWFDCSCCPTNMCRFIASVPGYIYAQSNNALYVNLFAQSSSTVQLNKKLPVTISQETKYPWDGQVKISVSPEKTSRFALCLRIPGWAENQVVPSDLYSFVSPETGAVSVTVNGEPVQYKTEKGYAVIDHEWKQGDVVSYNIPMSIRRVQANAQVADDAGKVAIERGPIVYCLEGADNGADLMTLSLPDSSKLTESYNSGELSGVVTISGDAEIAKGKKTEVRKFTAIPYFVWNNRGADEMKVWIPRK
ncbi:MAG: glycoside hydrolase family 127 protein [Prolixibacteraceae bacterium]|nr:glycoside hydrolase family 127 protein [Prolixibacteraceae bacterium]